MEAGSPVAESRQGTEAEVCFGLTEPKMLVDVQGVSLEAPRYPRSAAYHSHGTGAQEIADSPSCALGMK